METLNSAYKQRASQPSGDSLGRDPSSTRVYNFLPQLQGKKIR